MYVFVKTFAIQINIVGWNTHNLECGLVYYIIKIWSLYFFKFCNSSQDVIWALEKFKTIKQTTLQVNK